VGIRSTKKRPSERDGKKEKKDSSHQKGKNYDLRCRGRRYGEDLLLQKKLTVTFEKKERVLLLSSKKISVLTGGGKKAQSHLCRVQREGKGEMLRGPHKKQ